MVINLAFHRMGEVKMNNTRVYFLTEGKKISWYFADIITV